MQDALGQKRFKDLSLEQVAKVYLKVCKTCELTLRMEEWRAAGDAALDRYGTDYATMRRIEAEIFRARKGEKWTQRAEAYPQAITMLDDEEGFKYLTRAESARMKTEKCRRSRCS